MMTWNETFPKGNRPTMNEMERYLETPLWGALCTYLEQTYQVAPLVEHSICSGAPGWNVKYRKGGKALCTLYPAHGYFTCMVSIGSKQAMEAELLLAGCTEEVQALYWRCKPFNGSRWMMIEVRSPALLSDVKALISTRAKPERERSHG